MKLIVVFLFTALVAVQCVQIVVEKKQNSVKHIVKNVKTDEREWWETAVFYQIYPRSFKDSNNDGIGDLQGILQKLDHLKDSGITAAWLSPIFKSPQVDQGYDISDYRSIDPDYGTQEDFLQLLEKAHNAGIKIILDFVPNHTSDKHQWFIDSENRVKGYEDYYTWHDGITDGNGNRSPPNNWISLFRGPAWTWSEKRQQYYLNQFASAQPDLNYRNKIVVQEMKDILTYWLDFGVDGFRIDAVPFLFEDKNLTDEPKSNLPGHEDSDDYDSLDHIYTKDLNETFDMIYQWRDHMDSYSKEKGGEPRIIMTEAYTTFENTLLYFGTEDGSRLGAHFSFNFDFISNLNINSTDDDIIEIIFRWQSLGFSFIHYNWVLGNHDNHRVATRLGTDSIDLLNMLVAMLPGIGVTFNGEEIGMEDGEVTCEEGKDPAAIKDCSTFNETSRDFERTPYHWDSTTNAGFNDGAETWLPVSEKYLETNLANENIKGIESHFNLYKELIEIRKEFKKINPTESFTTARIGEHSIEIARRAYDQDSSILYDYVLILNPNNVVDKVSVSDNVTVEKYTVVATSMNSAYNIGDIIQRKDAIILNEYESIILKSN